MEFWYHGTPDVTGLEKEGGFTSRSISVEYLKNIQGYHDAQDGMKKSRETGDEDSYWKYINSVPSFKDKFTMRKPIFLTNDYSVAKTYADPHRSGDYQNAKEKVLKIKLDEGSVVKIVATGDRFRFIEVSKVKQGFINAGVNSNKIDELIERLTFAQRDNTKLKTDAIAVLGEWFGFDYIDVIGVLDSYEGGSIKSTVRMVFDPKKITVMDNINKNEIKESFEEYSNDALTDMIINLSRYEGNEEAIQRVKKELNKRKGIGENKVIGGRKDKTPVQDKGKDPKDKDKVIGGLADDIPVQDIAKKHKVTPDVIKSAIDKGIKVEMEHTSDKDVAYEVAKDHVYEDPKYYDKLKKMETNESKEPKVHCSKCSWSWYVKDGGDDLYTCHECGHVNNPQDIKENTKSIIKKLIREKVELMVTDETPESVSVLVQYNDRNAGIITVMPSPKDEDILELIAMDFKSGYEEPHIMRDALNGLWPLFPEIKSFIVAPKPESIAFWNRMGFDRISPNYLISNRGH